MTVTQMEAKLTEAVRAERKINKEVIVLIAEAMKKKVFAARGYSSMFEYLVKHHGYTESEAGCRLNAARVLMAVPETEEKLERGDINASVMAQAQRVFYAQEKATNKKVSKEEKMEALSKIENQSKREATQTLFEIFPDAAEEAKKEKVKVASQSSMRLSADIPNEVWERFEKVRELLSNKLGNPSFIEAADHLMQQFLKAHEAEVRKAEAQIEDNVVYVSESKPRVNETVTPKTKKTVLGRAEYQCEFEDPLSGKRCESRSWLQVDHVIPVALGGTNELSNLRCLCATHNRYMSEVKLGADWASCWKRAGQS